MCGINSSCLIKKKKKKVGDEKDFPSPISSTHSYLQTSTAV